MTSPPETEKPPAATRGENETDDGRGVARRIGTGNSGTSGQLPQFVRDMISAPPAAGAGVHAWLFKVSRQLHAHRSPDEIIDLLALAVEGCGRSVPRGEIAAAVLNSKVCAWRLGERTTHPAPPPAWPPLNAAKRAEVVSSGFGLADLWEASPTRMDEDGPDTEEIIDVLFPGNPLLCCAKELKRPVTANRETFRGTLRCLQFIVPSEMSAATGLTKSGTESPRCLANTGPRAFLVVEFDNGTTDDQAAILDHLSNFAPLVLAVHSGGKSLHAWFRFRGKSDQEAMAFMRYAVGLGADPATFVRCQSVRMPGGVRDNGTRQTVHFFNPGVAR